ncbi:MAG TPA: VOC family protein [Rhodopila sp.]|nr:VOC family protein [Rhodopila sp.]
MALAVQHVHHKSRDPKATAQYYVDNFGATIKGQMAGSGLQIDLHGLQINITEIIATQNHEQHLGLEHIAITTDDYPGTIARLRGNGVKILEELTGSSGNRVAFVESTDGAQMEIIEQPPVGNRQ